ncbi:MAG: histidine kinase [Bacteroidota bacterium]|nr:histidine kinase [Bacteroidota bacterium]
MDFSSKENNVSFDFLAMNYKMNGRIPYRFRINGGEWTHTFNTSLTFSELSPRDRLLEIQAQNEDKHWSESAKLLFIIHPPWWMTGWASILFAFIALGFLLWFYYYRIHRLKKAYKIKMRIKQLERAALQAQMNPHFIFNCLNSIQNYIYKNEKDEAIKYLGSFAGLVRSMLNASVAGKISLDEEIKLLQHYLELEKARFKNKFDFEIKTSEGLDLYENMIPPLLVQPYIENAVKHGIFGRDSGGMISVFFKMRDKLLEVMISDNGNGNLEDSRKSNQSINHKSFGMSITQNRLELLAEYDKNSPVVIKTLFDDKAKKCGTSVFIQIGLTE